MVVPLVYSLLLLTQNVVLIESNSIHKRETKEIHPPDPAHSDGETGTLKPTTDSWSIHPVIIVLLIAVPIIIVALVIAILLYRKKSGLFHLENKKETDGSERKTSVSQTPGTIAAATVTQRPPASNGALYPALYYNNQHLFNNLSDEASVEILGDSFSPDDSPDNSEPICRKSEGNTTIPAVSRENLPDKTRSIVPREAPPTPGITVTSVVPPTPVRNLTRPISSKATSSISHSPFVEPAEIASVRDDPSSSDKENKPKGSLEEIPNKKEKKRNTDPNRKEVILKMVKYGGPWKTVYEICSDFSFSIDSMADPK